MPLDPFKGGQRVNSTVNLSSNGDISGDYDHLARTREWSFGEEEGDAVDGRPEADEEDAEDADQ